MLEPFVNNINLYLVIVLISNFGLIAWLYFKLISTKTSSELPEHQKDNTLSLESITKQAVLETDIDSFIEKIIPKIASSLEVEYIQIMEMLPNRYGLFFKAGYGWQRGLVGAATVAATSNSLFGYTLAATEPIIITDLPIETRFRGGPLLDNHQITSGVALAIGTAQDTYGLLGVYSKQQREFNSQEIEFLLSISHLLALVFHNQRQQEELKLFKRALDASSNGILIADALELDNPVIYVNKSFTEITGYTQEEIIGKNCRILQKNDRQQPQIKEIRQAIIEGRECHQILRNYRKDGTLYWNELYLTPIRDRYGCLTHFLGIQKDITNRKIAEQALKNSESRFRAIFEQAAVGMAQVSIEGRFLQVNQKVCELWGYQPTELIKLKFQDITHPEDLSSGENLCQALLQKKIPTFTQEKRYLHRDGSIVWGQVTVSLVQEDSENTNPYFIVVVIDITERKQLETELENFNRNLKYLHKVSTQPYYDLKVLLFNYLETGCHMLKLSTGIITEITKDGYQVNTLYSQNLPLNSQTITPIEQSFCDQIKQTQKTITYNNPDLEKAPFNVYIGTPIWVNAEMYGILSFWGNPTQQKNFTHNQCQIVELMAESIAKLLYNKQITTAKLANEKRFNSILASLKDGVWSMDYQNQQIFYMNITLRLIFGYSRVKLPMNQQFWLEQVFYADQDRVRQISENFLKYGGNRDLEYRIVRPDGRIIWIRDRAQFIYDNAGNPLRIDGIITDITERKQIEEQLRQERDLLDGITQTSVAAIMVLDLEGKIIFANERTEEILAITKQELLGSTYDQKSWQIRDFEGNRLPPEALPFNKVMETKGPVFEILHTIKWRDHTVRFLSVNGAPLRKSTGEIEGVVLCINDITEQQTLEQKLIHNAFYDSLTSLPNRVLFKELLNHCLEKHHQDPNYQFAVLFLDLDRFKLVNDTYGHQIGDRLLVDFARRIEQCLGENDILARLSGDEFAIILDQLSQDKDAIAIAEAMQAQLKVPFTINGRELSTSVSIGVTMSSIGYHKASEILRDADLSMYKVKENGRGGYQIFAKSMYNELLRRVDLEADLSKALEREEFYLDYQPIIELKTRKIVGFETLIRWRHPHKGLISPGEFIPITEESNLIIDLGKWVLTQACRQLQIWQEKYDSARSLSISVNISAKQLKEPDLVATVEAILRDTQIDKHLLKLEITESVLMENETMSIEILEELQKRGISLCIDDFGTGYSSLSYLHHFPVNVLKVDQSFVKRIGDQSDKIEVIQGIIALAHSLNLEVIAEGIETAEQYDFLKSIDCEYGQGYWLYRPLNTKSAEQLMKEG